MVVLPGSRYVSWLPSFSVEVTHTQILGNGMDLTLNPIHTSQLDNMVSLARTEQASCANVKHFVALCKLGPKNKYIE